MRPRGSVVGPLLLIGVGVLFLIHTLSPNFRIDIVFGNFWPYFLILWGFIQLIEIAIRAVRGLAMPSSGISGGGWFIAILICLLGWSTFEFRRADTWWRQIGFSHGAAMFGDEHEFSLPPLKKTAGHHPRIVLEDFRGNAKITGSDTTDVSLVGRKSIRSLTSSDSDRANGNTPVELIEQGDSFVVRCHQDRAGPHEVVTTDLELTVPKDASIQASGSVGDFDISAINGDLDLKSGNAGVRLQNIGGGVKVETGKSDVVHCDHIGGPVEVRGHGDDVELEDIGGSVSVDGDYSGTVSLTRLGKTARVKTMRAEFSVASVPGTIRLERGRFDGENVAGPIHLAARATDVTLRNWTDSLDFQIDKGDVSIDSSQAPTAKIVVHNVSGDIGAVFPEEAQFHLSARTGQGDIDNDFTGGIQEQTKGHGSSLQGSFGNGPEVDLVSDRGNISIHKSEKPDPALKPTKAPATGRDLV